MTLLANWEYRWLLIKKPFLGKSLYLSPIPEAFLVWTNSYVVPFIKKKKALEYRLTEFLVWDDVKGFGKEVEQQ